MLTKLPKWLTRFLAGKELSVPTINVKLAFGSRTKMEKALWTPEIMAYFKPEEFASPDAPDSGYEMQYGFIDKLVCIRKFVNRPFIINSGFRTKSHNESLISKGYKASPDSPHLKGLAADIKILDSAFLYSLLKYCYYFKIKRIGIAKTFCHVDMDDTKQAQEVIWSYD
jgi:hypothetical protein